MISILEISKLINGKIVGNKNLEIENVCGIENGNVSCITYLKNSSFEKYINTNKASVFIVNKKLNLEKHDKTFLVVENPSMSFIKVLDFFKSKKTLKKTGISNKAIISPKAKIGKNVYVGPNVCIEEGAFIADYVSIHPGTFIGYNSIINKNTEICSNVTIHENVTIGENCRIDSGTVVGSEGFGIISSSDNNNYNIPHLGCVIIENNVTIGSNCSIDRGTINDTVISEFTKLDNLIQIGHNVIIGRNCLIASQVGIAGSTKIGDNVIIAGQSGIIDHINVGDNSTIAVKSCVYKNLPENSFVSGIPAINHLDKLKQDIIIKKLPLIYKNIKK